MNAREFNYHVKRVAVDENSLKAVYDYSVKLIRQHVLCKFGNSTFYSTVPHDVFTKCIFEYPPKSPIGCPAAWLCRIADNYVYSLIKRCDNRTLELTEKFSYTPDYEKEIEFTLPEMKRAWDTLDNLTQYIVYLEIVHKYKLKEIAYIIDEKPAFVRTRKHRAFQILKSYDKLEKVK